jgi:2',3'-cyclic-nucleotide 2'-phosphodiesterase (5'-nucleotidase family)
MVPRRRLGLASKARSRLLPAVLALATSGCRKPEPAPFAPPITDPPTTPAPPSRGQQIALLYSSNLGGTIAPCRCTLPQGGVARRATLIARTRAEADAVVVVDAGDLFDPTTLSQGTDVTERRARLLATAMVAGGLTAFTPGEADLALGLAVLRRVAAGANLPITSANLYGPSGERLFDADRLVGVAGGKVGIFGVTGPPSPAHAAVWRAAGIVVRDPADAAREAVRSLRDRGAAVVVALIHVGAPSESRRLVGAVDGIDWAVLGHSGLNLETPEKVGGARLLEAMSEGKNLGRLDLHVVGGSWAFADRAERSEIASILADHRRQLDEYDRPVGDQDPASLVEYRETRRRQLGQAIDRERALLAHLPATITGSWFENHVVALDPGIPDDPGVATLIERTQRATPRTGGQRSRSGHNALPGGAGGHL